MRCRNSIRVKGLGCPVCHTPYSDEISRPMPAAISHVRRVLTLFITWGRQPLGPRSTMSDSGTRQRSTSPEARVAIPCANNGERIDAGGHNKMNKCASWVHITTSNTHARARTHAACLCLVPTPRRLLFFILITPLSKNSKQLTECCDKPRRSAHKLRAEGFMCRESHADWCAAERMRARAPIWSRSSD